MNPFFQILQKDTAQSRVLLSMITPSQKKGLEKMAKNILHGHVVITRAQKNQLKPYAAFLRKLSNGDIKSGRTLRSRFRPVELLIRYTLKNETSTKTRPGTSGRMGTIKRKKVGKSDVHQRPTPCSNSSSSSSSRHAHRSQSYDDDDDDDEEEEEEEDDNTSSTSSFEYIESANNKSKGRDAPEEQEEQDEDETPTSA
jgi:hypothetical protein